MRPAWQGIKPGNLRRQQPCMRTLLLLLLRALLLLILLLLLLLGSLLLGSQHLILVLQLQTGSRGRVSGK
jgi:hypothetical protein